MSGESRSGRSNRFKLQTIQSKRSKRGNKSQEVDTEKEMRLWVRHTCSRLEKQCVRLYHVLAYLFDQLLKGRLTQSLDPPAGFNSEDFSEGKEEPTESVDLCLILGGDDAREREALRSANEMFPQTPIWMTGPALSEECLLVCRSVGCDTRYIRVDYHAVDTLSNFTTLVDDIEECRFRRIALFTSKNHMMRGVLIASLILPGYGVTRINPVVVKQHRMSIFSENGYKESSNDGDEESPFRVLRDVIRAILWMLFAFDPAQYMIRFLHPERALHKARRVDSLSFRGGLATQRTL